MIDSLKIRNFGPHKKLDVEFAPTVTTIVGPSYAGKSAIIRALRWVCLNLPAGNSFIHWNSDKAVVQLTADENKIIRKKGSNLNLYKLNKKPFTAFGNEVPSEIAKILNLSDINFQKQMTLPFWFDKTAGEVSRQLNSIVNLGVIDSTLANIVSLLNSNNSTIKVTKQRIKSIKEEEEKLSYIKKMDEDCQKVESIHSLYEKNAVESSTIADFIKLVVRYRLERNNAVELKVGGLKALSIGKQYREIAGKAELLQELTEKAQKALRISKNKPPSLAPLEKIKTQLEQTKKSSLLLLGLLAEVEEQEERISNFTSEVTKLNKQIEIEMNGRCPLCGKKLTK